MLYATQIDLFGDEAGTTPASAPAAVPPADTQFVEKTDYTLSDKAITPVTELARSSFTRLQAAINAARAAYFGPEVMAIPEDGTHTQATFGMMVKVGQGLAPLGIEGVKILAWMSNYKPEGWLTAMGPVAAEAVRYAKVFEGIVAQITENTRVVQANAEKEKTRKLIYIMLGVVAAAGATTALLVWHRRKAK